MAKFGESIHLIIDMNSPRSNRWLDFYGDDEAAVHAEAGATWEKLKATRETPDGCKILAGRWYNDEGWKVDRFGANIG